MKYKITALAENTTYRHNVLAQHGQSILIEVDDYKLLFDVGEVPNSVTHNMTQLGISLKDIKDVVISHRHIDHIGSLKSMLPEFENQNLFLPMQLGEPHIKEESERYSYMQSNPDGGYDVAISNAELQHINEYSHSKVVENHGFELAEDIYTTGCVGDWMMEQAVVIDQKEKGITLIVGCSHPTVEVLLDKATEVTGNQKVRGIIGGFHYTDLNETEVKERAENFLNIGLEFLVPSHCTTVRGALTLQEVLGDKVHMSKTCTLGAGNSIELGDNVVYNFA